MGSRFRGAGNPTRRKEGVAHCCHRRPEGPSKLRLAGMLSQVIASGADELQTTSWGA